jgi:hypothetical protein
MVCRGFDFDSEMLMFRIFDRYGNELTNHSLRNINIGGIFEHEIDYIEALDDNKAQYIVLSDEFDNSEKILISSENNLMDILYAYKYLVIFTILFIIISYFLTPRISFIYLILNRDRLNIQTPSNKYFMLSDLWMAFFAFIFGFGLMDLHFVVDTASVINLIMILLTILGYFKDKIGSIFPICIVICSVFGIMLLSTSFSPIVSMFIIFSSLPSVLYMYHKICCNTNTVNQYQND